VIKNKSYSNLLGYDATGILKNAIDAGMVHNRDDGRFEVKVNYGAITPWVFIMHQMDMDCYLWHYIYFERCGFIPSPCHFCFKIVVRPANLKAAFDFHDIMCELDYPSKIGWEQRDFVFGNFGAYFYNTSLEEAKDKIGIITDAAKNIELLDNPFTGEKFNPIIKKGCTEFEYKFGPSDQWIVSEEQKLKESILKDTLVFDNKDFDQADHRKATIFRLWIHNAFKAGDKTVSKYTNGRSLFPQYITYSGEENG